jgi:hypothetical protein
LMIGLLMTEIGGAHWAQANWPQAAGVGVAGAAYLTRMPMLEGRSRLSPRPELRRGGQGVANYVNLPERSPACCRLAFRNRRCRRCRVHP